MSTEANNALNTEAEQQVDEAVLPSDEAQGEVNPFDLSSFKDEEGKLAGKFDNAEDLMKSYNEAQEYIQKINADRAREGNEKVKAEKTAEIEQTASNIEQKLMTEFIDGSPSEETIQAAKDAGFSDDKIENIGFKSRDSVSKIVEKVGSMETFNTMIETLSSELSDSDKATFNKMAGNELTSEIALLGLQAKYNAITGGNQPQDRVRGSVNGTAAKGYSSQQEMLADLAALRENPNNKAMQVAYENKKRLTHDDVVYGRK